MDYAKQLQIDHSRINSDKVVKAVGNDPAEFAKLVELLYTGEAPVPQRVSWAISLVSKLHPELTKPYVTRFINAIRDFKIGGIRRNLLNALCTQEIPKKIQGKTVTICVDFILSPDEPVAVKVLSLEILCNIAQQHPDLKTEIKAVIDDQLPKTSPAFHARAKHVLKRL